MRHHLLRLALACGITFCSSVSAQPWDGPFGLEMGLTLDQLKAAIPDLKESSEFNYYFEKAPKPYGGADGYMVRVSETSGLCRVGAFISIKDSGFGDNTKGRFERVEGDLARKYGPPSGLYDFLKPGSIWREPSEWMMGLLKGDRVLTSRWGEKGKDMLGDIKDISLEAKSSSLDTAFIYILYEFSNHDLCEAEAEARRSDAL